MTTIYNPAMAFDPVVSLRIINNERLRNAQGWAEHRDLGGVLAMTSDAPIPDLNCLEAFNTTEAKLEGLLDIGFALLRAFDCDPAAQLTPLDRPKSVAKHLERRGLRATDRWHTMVFRGDVASIPVNPTIDVRRVEPDDVPLFVSLHAGGEKWVRRLSMSSTLAAINEPGNSFYLAYVEGQPVATTHLLVDGATAGIYAVGTQKAHRRQGIATTLLAAALRDAQAAGCDVIGLRTLAGSDAERLYRRHGFELAHESRLYETPTA
ncbi:MAG: GNAT family N-acetyltransferase [Dehalococcoidia bacterium]